jgi:hypothetical protein
LAFCTQGPHSSSPLALLSVAVRLSRIAYRTGLLPPARPTKVRSDRVQLHHPPRPHRESAASDSTKFSRLDSQQGPAGGIHGPEHKASSERRIASRRCPGEPRGESTGDTDQRNRVRRPRPGCLRDAQTALRASSHSCHRTRPGDRRVARQAYGELGDLADPAIDLNRAAVLLGHDVVADREAEAGPLAGRLGRKERLEQLIPDIVWADDETGRYGVRGRDAKGTQIVVERFGPIRIVGARR